MPVKPLSFKGDKSRPKKRKHRDEEPTSTSTSLTQSTTPQDDDNESWVDPDAPADLTGPVILVLPTQPPTCLASDAHGNVFASTLENMVENNPLTAEPHDVRQVWVVTRVAGMGEGEVSLKGSHGGYLSCDEMGILGAKREARGSEETFTVESIPTDEVPESSEGSAGRRGTWRLRTAASKKQEPHYLSAMTSSSFSSEDPGERKTKISISLRGDGDKASDGTRLILRMQARFKPKLQRDREQKKSEKVSRAELERVVGRRLEDEEMRRLKKAKRDGTYHEEILDVRVKGKHDKFA